VWRYRFHIGHSYSEKDLVVKQYEILESTLWVALRIIEERRNLLKKLGRRCGENGAGNNDNRISLKKGRSID
jgi:two-component system chemotaxis response regulator CheB